MSPIIESGVYRHYKGGLCLVLGMARHADTGEALVVYVRLYRADEGAPSFPMAVRPAADFFVEVEVDGEQQTRFEYVGQFS